MFVVRWFHPRLQEPVESRARLVLDTRNRYKVTPWSSSNNKKAGGTVEWKQFLTEDRRIFTNKIDFKQINY